MPEVTQFRSRKAAHVESAWEHVAPSSRLQQVTPELSFEWRSIAVDHLSVAEYRLTASVRSSVRPEGQLFVCQTRLVSGSVRSGRQELRQDRPWITDGREVSAVWEGTADVRALAFDPVWAQETARRITGDDRLLLRATDVQPGDHAAAAQWSRMVRRLAEDLASLHDSPLLVTENVRHALMVTLAAFPGTLHASRTPSVQVRPTDAIVHRAIAFIDEHAHEPITTDDVAAAVHLSTRGLQYAFHRVLGITPREQVRRARLDGAHRDLLAAPPDETVSAIARRWGFAHPSRFAAQYRAAYGRLPRETLRRD